MIKGGAGRVTKGGRDKQPHPRDHRISRAEREGGKGDHDGVVRHQGAP